MRRLPFLAACAAAIAIAGCGGGDDGSSSSSGTPAQSESDNPTEQLFAGSATANLKDPAQGKKGGTLTVLSAGDVDFLDPAVAPASGTVVPGGATYREAHLVMETLCDAGIVGSVDVVELNPFLDERGRTAITATRPAAPATSSSSSSSPRRTPPR